MGIYLDPKELLCAVCVCVCMGVGNSNGGSHKDMRRTEFVKSRGNNHRSLKNVLVIWGWAENRKVNNRIRFRTQDGTESAFLYLLPFPVSS